MEPAYIRGYAHKVVCTICVSGIHHDILLFLHCIFVLRCFLKLGDWCTNLEEKNLSSSTISTILEFYKLATEHDTGWYKAWHAWAYMNFQALLQHKQEPSGATACGAGDGREGGKGGDICFEEGEGG